MAGLGRKVFVAGDVLTAAQVQGYLQDQTIMVFAGTASGSTVLNLFDSPEEAVGFVLTISLFLGETWLLPLPGCNFF